MPSARITAAAALAMALSIISHSVDSFSLNDGGSSRRQAGIADCARHLCEGALVAALTTGVLVSPLPAYAADVGASTAASAKITTGGASTLQSGRTIAITRGVNLDRSDFKGLNLKGVAFQQSIVRDTDFRGTNLYG